MGSPDPQKRKRKIYCIGLSRSHHMVAGLKYLGYSGNY